MLPDKFVAAILNQTENGLNSLNPPHDTKDGLDDDPWDLTEWDLSVVDGPDDEDEFVTHEEDTDPHLIAVEGLDEYEYARKSLWVRRLFRTVALIALISFGTAFIVPPAYRSIRSLVSRPSTPDYLSAVLFDRLALRFQRDEIRYTIVLPAGYPQQTLSRLEPTVLKALQSWEDALDGQVTFVPASSSGGDDLLIRFVADLPGTKAGLAGLRPGTRYRPEIFIKLDPESRLPRAAILETIALHEIGHALGLWGHSDFEGDCMYPIASHRTPSDRDIRTIRLLYSMEAAY